MSTHEQWGLAVDNLIALKTVFVIGIGTASACLVRASIRESWKSFERWAGLIVAGLFAGLAFNELVRILAQLRAA